MTTEIRLPKNMDVNLERIRKFYGVTIREAVIMSMSEGIDVHLSRIAESEDRKDDSGHPCMDCAYCAKRSPFTFVCIHPEMAADRQCMTLSDIQSNSCAHWEES